MRFDDREAVAPHLLVVDDEPAIRDLLSRALEEQGYRVTAREDGASALEALRRQEVAVLLTDLRMPGMTGLELIREAKRLRPRLGSVVMTAFASVDTALEALRQGADDYLTKPFALADVRRIVDRVLQTQSLIQRDDEALLSARREAEDLRLRSVQTERDLATTRHDLTLSRRDLERRVRDLRFVADFTRLIARDGDLERVLPVTARILSARFHCDLTRIEVDLEDGVRTAEHAAVDPATRRLATMVPDLLARARRRPDGILRDAILGLGRPLEGLVAALDVGGAAAGGVAMIRPAPVDEDPGDLFLLGLLAHSLQVAIEADLQRRASERNAIRVATGLLELLEGRGLLWRGHGQRTARLAGAIARRLGMSPRLVGVVETAGRLHDVGLVGLPESTFRRPGPLTESEREQIHRHPAVGARILATFGEAASFVRAHRERPDGTGYPDGLEGPEIPMGAAVIAVAEAYDAMTHPRPWRASMDRDAAREEIRRLRGTQFVAEAADAFLDLPVEAP
jgi:response regulator RpfG family c-di-GMP phosphodiesterase